MQNELGDEVVAEITAAGGSAAFIALDVTDAAAWGSAVAKTVELFGGLDVPIRSWARPTAPASCR